MAGIGVALLAAGMLVAGPDPASAASVLRVPIGFATIQEAIDAASDGDTVRVGPGTHIGQIDFKGKSIVVESVAGAKRTIIDSGGSGPVVRFTSGEGRTSVLRGFTITGAAQPPMPAGGGVRIKGTSPTIENSIITGNNGCLGLGVYVDRGSPLIQDTRIEDNGGIRFCSTDVRYGRTVYVKGDSSVTLLRVAVTGNEQGGIGVYDGVVRIEDSRVEGNERHGLYLEGNGQALVTNSLFRDNSPSSIAQWQLLDAPRSVIIHSTVLGYPKPEQRGSAIAVTASMRIVGSIVAGVGAPLGCSTNNHDAPGVKLSVVDTVLYEEELGSDSPAANCPHSRWDGVAVADPRLVDPFRDPRLRPDSPAVDFITDALADHDLEGSDRPQDGDHDGLAVADAGAFELSASGVSGTTLSLPGGRVVGGICVGAWVPGGGRPIRVDSTLSDLDGSFFLGLPAGVYRLRLEDCRARVHRSFWFGGDRFENATDVAVAAGGVTDIGQTGLRVTLRCGRRLATILGTPRGDEILGTPGDDVIVGLGGQDDIDGAGGDDRICGGPGNDVILGGTGSDRIAGDEGEDQIFGGEGPDALLGNDGDDHLDGGEGRDLLAGGAGDDTLHAGPGTDRASGGPGFDFLDFSLWNRGIVADLMERTVDDGRVVERFAGIEGVIGTDWADLLRGGDLPEELRGSGGNDRIEGGPGNDWLTGGDGADVIDGGKGDDLIAGGSDDDYLDGGPGADEIHGEDGDDLLKGSSGDDYLDGHDGFNVLNGGAGYDECRSGAHRFGCEEYGRAGSPWAGVPL